jgi:hypothetical protein
MPSTRTSSSARSTRTTRSTRTSRRTGTPMDAFALLKADHKKVKGLFNQFKKAKKQGADESTKAALVAQICMELRVHAQIEEEIFYPAVRERIEDQDIMDEALVEHAGAKDLIAQLEGMAPGDDLYDAKVTVLGEEIDHHVKEEEGSMFRKAKRARVDTVQLGEELKARKAELMPEEDARGNGARSRRH